jgi:predicted RNA-binding Zn-ribbon protein involved in translation (DUF1610 family)
MSKLREILLKCPHCGERYPWRMYFESTEAFESSLAYGVFETCRKCGHEFRCTKDNVAFVLLRPGEAPARLVTGGFHDDEPTN